MLKKFVRLAALVAEGEVLALAEEVARRELRLHEEPAALGVTAAELDVVLPFLDALDGDVHRLRVRIDLEVGILRDLEVAELAELVEALLEGLHVHDLTFLEEDLAAEHLVFGGGVAFELQAAEAELLALEDAQVHVDDVVALVDVLRIDVARRCSRACGTPRRRRRGGPASACGAASRPS